MPSIDQIERDLQSLLDRRIASNVEPINPQNLPDLDPTMFLSAAATKEYQAAQALKQGSTFHSRQAFSQPSIETTYQEFLGLTPPTTPKPTISSSNQITLEEIWLKSAMIETGADPNRPILASEDPSIEFMTEDMSDIEGLDQYPQRHPTTQSLVVSQGGPERRFDAVVSQRNSNGRFEPVRPSAEALRRQETQQSPQMKSALTQPRLSTPSLPAPSTLDRILGASPFDHSNQCGNTPRETIIDRVLTPSPFDD